MRTGIPIMTSHTSPQQALAEIAAKTLQQAVACHQANDFEGAEKLYRDILRMQPNHAEANHNLGVLSLQNNQAIASLPYFTVALDADPANGRYWLSYIDALCEAEQLDDARQILALAQQHGLSGADVDKLAMQLSPATAPTNTQPDQQEINTLVTHFNQGQLTEALALAQTLSTRYPNHDAGWKALGVAYQQMGRHADALAPMQRATKLVPQDAEAHNNLGITLNALGRYDEAEASYRRALKLSPTYAQAHSNLGAALHSLMRLDDAVACYRKALQHNPGYVRAHNNLGATLHDLRRLDEAEASYRKALALNPNYADAHRNLGITLHDLDRLDEAEASYQNALQLNANDAETYSYLGNTLKDLGRLEDAEASHRHALSINPNFVDALYNLSHVLLTMGKLVEAWPKYEYRWDANTLKKMQRPATTLPQWLGQTPSPGDRILVFKEQGMGDQIQLSRYLPLLAQRFPAGVSLVTTPALHALFQRAFPSVEILDSMPIDQTAWQWQCPLMSLPLAFNTQLSSIPDQVPYLIPDPIKSDYWAAKIVTLNLPATKRKIGVVWKPGSLMKNASLRALTLQQLSPLLDLDNCVFFSLQKEPDTDKASWIAAGKLIDWSNEFDSFDDTAALINNLDLVISVDTSVAHLAGALGCPIWLLNRHASEWRWLRDREDSPWYPTMHIYTQEKAGDWSSVIARIAAALR
jgi:tetratricopeptide (TPR) repeat protein